MSVDERTDEKSGLNEAPRRVEQDAETVRHVNRLGPPLVQFLFSASKTAQVHEITNRAMQRAMTDLMAPLNELLQLEERVSLRISVDFLLINDVRLTVNPQGFGPFLYLMEEMKKRGVEGIDFLPGVGQDDVSTFLKLFFDEAPPDDAFDFISSTLQDRGMDTIRVVEWVDRERRIDETAAHTDELRESSNRVFFRTVALVGEVLRGIEQRRAMQVRKAERLTQQMVDIIQADESILVGLASIKKFDEYTFTHSVNVCILAMLMADRLRLYKSDIARLGVAALLHDIGKTYIPQTILNKPGHLTENDWELMKYHTFFGVKELSRIKSLRDVGDALFVALQHHVHYNMNGYPQKPNGWHLRLFSRIVTVADYYDAMTTPRIYSKEPLTPDRALRFILLKSGEIFDPFIAKVFIHAMGMYPIGTVVELDTGERAVVVRQNEQGRFIHRPSVVLLRSGDGEGEKVDLTSVAGREGKYRRSIVRAVYDEEAEGEKTECFLTAPVEPV